MSVFSTGAADQGGRVDYLIVGVVSRCMTSLVLRSISVFNIRCVPDTSAAGTYGNIRHYISARFSFSCPVQKFLITSSQACQAYISDRAPFQRH